MAESADKPGTGRHAKRITSILVTQPKPTNDVSPYFAIAEKYGIQVDFREFIEVQPVSYKDFRREKINIPDFTAVIFTSRNAVDHFFRICQEAKLEMPAEMKYFCISEQTANYLQKYIVLRKRKLFVGQRTAADLFEVIKKHKGENFLYPCSDIRKDDLPVFMRANNLKFSEAVIYRTVASDLSDLSDVKYDCIAFFSPSGISSLFINFPDFVQDGTRIAAFGPTTAKAVIDAGLILDIEAPHPNAPSMTGAIEAYIRRHAQPEVGKTSSKNANPKV
ncbi:uroporphyrinogen-III synthase [Hymenobacter sp. BT770]|uniref:uroporphyrinogen-III synthase n=1 Tax=Hymenobacter sp. BT770 TaxID=2886942 RepID=UPI001D12D708|nr:uroporphyrinogen-III synthase [Hymenobacter sp. BT770]MCC3153657.1 uroporphyrinogen-III synthase [Hymenobacter sp. BT770]MDO3415877.1 uroporphyrinogen-III synthase [Hymenobacter sp. BT770]